MKASLFAAALLLVTPLAVTGFAHAKPAPHYDCSKAGNKTKAACKATASSSTSSTATTSASPSSALASAQTAKTRTYDCTKAGNKNKAQCKTAMAPTPVVASAPQQPAVTAKLPTPTPAATVAKTSSMPAPAGAPAGATAQCKDGTFSTSQHHSGTCSHHGGVAKWLS